MSSVNEIALFLPFQSRCLFILFSSLIFLSRLSSTISNPGGDSRYLCLVPDLQKALILSLFNMMLVVGFFCGFYFLYFLFFKDYVYF